MMTDECLYLIEFMFIVIALLLNRYRYVTFRTYRSVCTLYIILINERYYYFIMVNQ